MARPRLDSPNYKLVRRGDTFYVRWWQDGNKDSLVIGGHTAAQFAVDARARQPVKLTANH